MSVNFSKKKLYLPFVFYSFFFYFIFLHTILKICVYFNIIQIYNIFTQHNISLRVHHIHHTNIYTFTQHNINKLITSVKLNRTPGFTTHESFTLIHLGTYHQVTVVVINKSSSVIKPTVTTKNNP